MKGMVPPDPETDVSQILYAVVYVPRRSRKRFSAGAVTVMEDQQAAIEAANPDKKYYAARVVGPSKSSEGQMIYYLVEWL